MPGEVLDFNDREVVLRADLSTVDNQQCVWTPVRFLIGGPRGPRPGERVLLVDSKGGGSCLGRVVSVTGWVACIRPEWETWRETKMPHRSRIPHARSLKRGPGAHGSTPPAAAL